MKERKNTGKSILAHRAAALLAAAELLAAVFLTGCGDAAASSDKSMYAAAPESNAAAAQGAYDTYGTSESADYDAVSDEAGEPASSEAKSSTATSGRKLIRTVNMEVETREYDGFLSSLQNEVQSRGGYIENMDNYNGSSYSGGRSARHVSLTLRIPKDELDGFLDMVSGLGNVVRQFENVEDVTLSYVDMESHRNALRTEQDRLLELLERAESLEDIITIEDRLANVRYQLESMESQLRTMDNQVDYGTVRLDVSEVQELTPVTEQTVWERICEGFTDSLKNIRDGAVELAVNVIVSSPYLILGALFIAVIVIVIRLSWNRSMRSAEKKRQQTKSVPPAEDRSDTGNKA